ncbi:MAG TPA: bifunctional riboflavin kinase/FAD synthetase [Thermoanaerobaculia bacterium]|nr:bifunctional riboflavin kinase/FAD synthetase [Thermoanaerobaculia bacterium]HQR67048.1 bifunctional riboflavin kinase/FAD synthetase [Thermoanaerobaculia bacterium]
MIVTRDPLRAADLPRGGIVTVGNFDGVHLGHQKMLRDVADRARSLGVPSVVVTFDPHPLKVLRPEEAPKMIQTLRQREEAIEACGIEALLIIPFTRDFSLTPAETFVRELLLRRLAAREVHVGERFTFGHQKGGNLALLTRVGAEGGMAVVGIADVTDGEARISSTRIRQALASGDVALAAGLLGRPYAMDGIVAKGDRMGRKLGFPTINLMPENELLPLDGVYLSTMFLPSFERTFGCVTNIGRRPTVYEDFSTTIESYVLDFSSNVYGEKVRLAFLGRIREERVFPSMLELTAQIRKDVEQTRLHFLRNPIP